LPDLIPGEVATSSNKINGTIHFTGTFLSLIPFALKYGLIGKDELILKIENSRVISMSGKNKNLVKDLEFFFEKHPNNRTIEEVGLGTNFGIKKLRGLNTAFEERHCGLHLGFGGREKGSHHLDFIFQEGCLFFDNNLIYNGKYLNQGEVL
jgi:aminopeptidase